jgi:uncharacterized membrane protein YccC
MKIGGGSAAPAPLGLRPSPIRWIAAAVAINTAALAIISAARTVPALTLSAVKAALVEAWTIPAVYVKADRDVLDRSARFARQISTYRRAQWRRLDTARHERACCQDGRRRRESQKKTIHDIDPPWIELSEVVDQRSR